MERYTIVITNKQGFEFHTSRFNFERFVTAAIDAMAGSSNGSARVTLIDGSKSTGDVVAGWYPKSRRDEYRRIEAEDVAEKMRAALSELRS